MAPRHKYFKYPVKRTDPNQGEFDLRLPEPEPMGQPSEHRLSDAQRQINTEGLAHVRGILDSWQQRRDADAANERERSMSRSPRDDSGRMIVGGRANPSLLRPMVVNPQQEQPEPVRRRTLNGFLPEELIQKGYDEEEAEKAKSNKKDDEQ